MKKAMALRLINGAMWLCEALGHPGGCRLLDTAVCQRLMFIAYH